MQILKDWCYVFMTGPSTDNTCGRVLDALKAIDLSFWVPNTEIIHVESTLIYQGVDHYTKLCYLIMDCEDIVKPT